MGIAVNNNNCNCNKKENFIKVNSFSQANQAGSFHLSLNHFTSRNPYLLNRVLVIPNANLPSQINNFTSLYAVPHKINWLKFHEKSINSCAVIKVIPIIHNICIRCRVKYSPSIRFDLPQSNITPKHHKVRLNKILSVISNTIATYSTSRTALVSQLPLYENVV